MSLVVAGYQVRDFERVIKRPPDTEVARKDTSGTACDAYKIVPEVSVARPVSYNGSQRADGVLGDPGFSKADVACTIEFL